MTKRAVSDSSFFHDYTVDDLEFHQLLDRIDAQADLAGLRVDDRHKVITDLNGLSDREFDLLLLHEEPPAVIARNQRLLTPT